MKIVILGAEARYRAYQPAMPFIQQQELVFLDKDSTEAEILAAGADAEVLFVDAITVVSAALMEHMPCLRLIHSEGVAFDRIDLSAARERGIYVCNNKGCNAGAVAEQTVLLILMLLRHALEGDEAVRAGRQMEMKERCMVEGITELSVCKVGLVGFGDIARAAAERLVPFAASCTTTPSTAACRKRRKNTTSPTCRWRSWRRRATSSASTALSRRRPGIWWMPLCCGG